MAGSYNHVVTDAGYLGDPEWVNDMLENGGDVYEAVEEMYGMIWFLADQAHGDEPTGDQLRATVERARQNYQRGLDIAREANRGQ